MKKLIFGFFCILPLYANSIKTNAINISPLGWAVKDRFWFSLNWESVLANIHGIVAEFTYSSAKSSSSSAKSVELNTQYRLHFSPGIAGFYVSLFLKGGFGSGNGTITYSSGTSEDFTLQTTYYAGGLNLGYRFVWTNGLNLNIRIGYGPSYLKIQSSVISDDIKNELETLGKTMGTLIGYDGEFSIGYAF